MVAMKWTLDLAVATENASAGNSKEKAEALAFERYTIANASQKEWGGQRADRRTLSELLDIWWKYHGQNHEHGTKSLIIYSKPSAA